MKILLIGPGKLKIMPYAKFYLDNIDCQNNEVHLAYWNRDCKNEDTSSFNTVHLHEFSCKMSDDESLLSKFMCFKKYRKYCMNLLTEKFDLLIILHSLSGMMLYDVLRIHRFKYIFDYRDSTYESKNKLFAKIVSSMSKHSIVTFVSSDSFRRYFPKEYSGKIYTSHNLLEDSLLHRNYIKIPSDKIRIAFWGVIRHFTVNKEIINSVANDSRLELHYYGREQKDAYELKQYVESIGANNIYFHGEYNPDDRYKFVGQTDIIHNIYSDTDTNMSLAMANKYYDSIIFRIPQICQVGSFMGEMSTRSGVGIVLNPKDSNFNENLVEYYKKIDRIEFNKNCDNELNRILEEYRKGQMIIKEIVNN